MKLSTKPLLVATLVLLFLVCASARYVHPRINPYLVIEGVTDAKDREVPLKAVDVQVEMIHSLAKVSIKQTYRNVLSVPIRASYLFPLDDRATISSFVAEFSNGKKLVGISKDKNQARQEFEEAVQQGQTAVLMDQHSSDVFKTEIGNLDTNQEVAITITYLTQVQMENSHSYRFFLPTMVSTRYRSSSSYHTTTDSTATETDASGGPNNVASSVPYRLNLDMKISMDGIKSISSPTHEITTSINGDGRPATASLVSGELDGDFVVLIKTTNSHETNVIVEADPSTKQDLAVLVTLNPNEFLLSSPTISTIPSDGVVELIFLVDVSGSMLGEKMRDTIKAMRSAMAELKETNRRILFNIIPFSSSFRLLFPTSQPLEDRTYRQAMDFIDHLEANGGTHILEPMEEIFAATPLGDLRRLIVLTDGLVVNTQAVIQLAKVHSGHTQVFSIGIGDGVSHALVNGLARSGGGTAEYVTLGEHVSDKVSRQLSRALSPHDVSVTIEFFDQESNEEPLAVTQSPALLPRLYTQSSFEAFFLVPRTTQKVVVRAANGEQKTFVLDPTTYRTTDVLHKMAARSMIRDLELSLESDEDSCDDWSQTTYEKQEARKVSIRKDIVKLATSYNLMTSLTSFVAVDPEVPEEVVHPKDVEVPVLGERTEQRVHSKMAHASAYGGTMASNRVSTTATNTMSTSTPSAPSGPRPYRPWYSLLSGNAVGEAVKSQIFPDSMAYDLSDEVSEAAELERLEKERWAAEEAAYRRLVDPPSETSTSSGEKKPAPTETSLELLASIFEILEILWEFIAMIISFFH